MFLLKGTQRQPPVGWSTHINQDLVIRCPSVISMYLFPGFRIALKIIYAVYNFIKKQEELFVVQNSYGSGSTSKYLCASENRYA